MQGFRDHSNVEVSCGAKSILPCGKPENVKSQKVGTAAPCLAPAAAIVAAPTIPMLYNLRRSLLSNPTRDYSRPQTARHRLLYAGMGHDGRRRLACHHGRLAAARWLLGTALGFLIGGALLLPIGWVYGKLVVAMPDAAGEVAYTAAIFPRAISFSTGWMMTSPTSSSVHGRPSPSDASPPTYFPGSIRWRFIASQAVRFIFLT